MQRAEYKIKGMRRQNCGCLRFVRVRMRKLDAEQKPRLTAAGGYLFPLRRGKGCFVV